MSPLSRAPIALALLISACVPKVDGTTGPVESADAVELIDENLARLNAIGVVEVGDLIVAEPVEAYNCYGPCVSEEELEVLRAEAKAEAAEKLADLADAAEAATQQPGEATFDEEAVAADVARLADLELVEVLRFVEEVPENNPNCYNLPCPEDEAAAEAITAERATHLRLIADAAASICGSGEDGY